MVWGMVSLPVKDTAIWVGGVIKAERGYKEGFFRLFLMKEKTQISTIPQLLLGEFAHVKPLLLSLFLMVTLYSAVRHCVLPVRYL